MPVREMKPERTTEHVELVRDLATEWADAHSTRAEPIIFIERSPDGKPLHVQVVWSRWAQLEPVERSEIIMDAAARQLSPDELLNITMAFGMTPDEARRLGFKF